MKSDIAQISEGNGDQFNVLCDNVESNILLTNSVIQEFLTFNLELSKYGLPTTLLLQLALISSRLQRSISDANMQVDELVRITRIYSVSWEQRSQSLKKLHQQYKSNQRKLDIAVKKLELLNGRNQQLEKQRIIMNWEKMFLKLNSSKHASLGWRHVVEEYNKKMAVGESVAYLFTNLNADETKQNTVKHKKQSYFNQDTNVMDDLEKDFDDAEDELDAKSSSSLDEDAPDSNDLFSDHSETEEELNLQSRIERNSIVDWVSRNDEYDPIVECIQSEDKEEVEAEEELGEFPSHENVGTRNYSIVADLNKPFLSRIKTPKDTKVEMIDKATTTSEEQYYYKFNLQVYKPRCFDEKELYMVVAFNDHLQKGEVFTIDPQDIEPSLELSTTDYKSTGTGENPDDMQEYSFGIDYYNGSDIFSCDAFQESKIRVAVHPGPTKSMIAFSAVAIKDLVVLDNQDNSHDKQVNHTVKKGNSTVPINELQLLATVEKGKMKFNQPCGQIFIQCFVTREKKFSFQDKGTGTVSLDFLVNEILSDERTLYLKRCKSACVETDEKPVYTEDDVSTLHHQLEEQLVDLKNEYEVKLENLLRIHNVDSKELVSMATSPIFKWDLELSPESSPTSYHEVTHSNLIEESRRHNGIIRTASKKWGKDLPRDFFTRLDMFQVASEKYHKELKDKIILDTDKEITKKLQAGRKLHKEGKESVYSADVYLPALFMPIKSNLRHPLKARSFLNSASNSNLKKQEHSVMQFPRLRAPKIDKMFGMCVEVDTPSVGNQCL